MSKYLSPKDDMHVEQTLAAVAAFPSLEEAKDYLKGQGLEAQTHQMKRVVKLHDDRYQQVRAQLAPKIEARLADDMLDNASLATTVERLAIERTHQLLEENKVSDPSTVGRNLSQMRSQAIDKRLALQGRPTSITETRNVDEVLNALEAMKVVTRTEPGVELEATVVEEATDGGS